jgi:hypothetical protein
MQLSLTIPTRSNHLATQDDRALGVVLLVMKWAKARKIDDPNNGTLCPSPPNGGSSLPYAHSAFVSDT